MPLVVSDAIARDLEAWRINSYKYNCNSNKSLGNMLAIASLVYAGYNCM